MARAAALAAALLALGAGACSGDDPADGGQGAEAEPTSTTLRFAGDAGSPFCELVRGYAADDDTTDPPQTPEATAAAYRTVLEQLQAVADVAPPELAEDTALVVTGMTAYVGALRSAGFDRDALAASPRGLEVSAAINDPAFATANARIDAYKSQVCDG